MGFSALCTQHLRGLYVRKEVLDHLSLCNETVQFICPFQVGKPWGLYLTVLHIQSKIISGYMCLY